jgi:CubicO group peptidase (beta-lactamase class C family)
MKANAEAITRGSKAAGRLCSFATLLMIVAAFATAAAGQETPAAKKWPASAPGAVGLDAAALEALDADLASGKYGLVDSMLVIRCGKQAFEHSYARDYDKIYGERAKKTGPLNHDLHGPYNYFSTEFHPYYKHSDLHTMQSVSKTFTSITMGVAMQRGDFKVDLDAPILKYFDGYTIANLDDRKRRISLRHLLTMSSGLEWHEDLAYDDPKNSADVMEATSDWVQYVINQKMVSDPGTSFVYSSGGTELLAYIFKKVAGKNVDEYAAEYLFQPIGMHYFWKHTPMGLPDTEGGLYVASGDLARIGLLFLHGGIWEGKQIVPADWIKQSVAPSISAGRGGWKYGFQWWLVPYGKAGEKLAWSARGFGGQQLILVPEYDLIVVFTGWDILPSSEKVKHDQLERILSAVDTKFSCTQSDKAAD